MKKHSFDAINEVLLPFYRIRSKLNEQFMLASDVSKILKVTKRQLLYWESKGMKFAATKSKVHAWRKYSVIDVFGFAILKSLRTIGLRLNQCDHIFDWLRTYVYARPFFMYHFAGGEPVWLLIDAERNRVKHIYGGYAKTFNDESLTRTNINIMIDVGAVFKVALEKVKKEDFRVKFANDKHGKYDKVIFYIEGEKIELMPSEKAFTYFYEKDVMRDQWGK